MVVQSSVQTANSVAAVRQDKAPPRDAANQGSAPSGAVVSGSTLLNSSGADASRKGLPTSKTAESGGVERGDAEVLAQRLEQVLNESSQTEVQFSVSAQEGEGSNSLSLRVVDKETGEVVREFPSEEIRSLARREDLASGQGIFVDSPA